MSRVNILFIIVLCNSPEAIESLLYNRLYSSPKTIESCQKRIIIQHKNQRQQFFINSRILSVRKLPIDVENWFSYLIYKKV